MLQVLAHRGASQYAPENTRAAFDLGMAMGADGLETDLHVTRDGAVVLIHDGTVDRTTDGSGPVAALPLAELQALDAGSWFSPRFAGERIPELSAFLDRYAGRTHLALEIKAPEAVEPAVRLAGAWGGWLVPAVTAEAVRFLNLVGAQQICPAAEGLTPEAVQFARQHGLAVRAWGVNTEALMRHAARCGVDGMTVNFPDRLLRFLGRRPDPRGFD